MTKIQMQNYISRFIRKKRRDLPWYGYTQADIAQKAGVRQATVSDIENGKSCPRVDVLYRVLEAMNSSYAEFSEFLQEVSGE